MIWHPFVPLSHPLADFPGNSIASDGRLPGMHPGVRVGSTQNRLALDQNRVGATSRRRQGRPDAPTPAANDADLRL